MASSGTLENNNYLMLVLQKAADLMLVMLSGILTLFRPKQSLKAKAPMLVTLSGIVTLVSLLHLMKA